MNFFSNIIYSFVQNSSQVENDVTILKCKIKNNVWVVDKKAILYLLPPFIEYFNNLMWFSYVTT